MIPTRPILLIALGLALMVGLAWGMRPNTPTPAPAPSDPGGPMGEDGAETWPKRFEQLRWELDNERQARLELARMVDQLRVELNLLAGTVGRPLPDDLRREPDPRETPNTNRAQAPAAETDSNVSFNEAELLERGISMREVADLSERYETWQMDQIFLRDRARREGWLNKPRFRRQMANLRGSLREEMGDGDYDLMLYATDQPNRVELSHLLHTSPGAEAGLQDGDLVLRYNERPIFNPRDLQLAITQAPVGTSSQVRVLRNGEEHVTYVPSGPIGAHLQAIRRSPFEP